MISLDKRESLARLAGESFARGKGNRTQTTCLPNQSLSVANPSQRSASAAAAVRRRRGGSLGAIIVKIIIVIMEAIKIIAESLIIVSISTLEGAFLLGAVLRAG